MKLINAANLDFLYDDDGNTPRTTYGAWAEELIDDDDNRLSLHVASFDEEGRVGVVLEIDEAQPLTDLDRRQGATGSWLGLAEVWLELEDAETLVRGLQTLIADARKSAKQSH